MQGRDRVGRSGVGSSDGMGLHSAEQLCQPVGVEVEGRSPVGRVVELENGRLEAERVRISEGEKRWC